MAVACIQASKSILIDLSMRAELIEHRVATVQSELEDLQRRQRIPLDDGFVAVRTTVGWVVVGEEEFSSLVYLSAGTATHEVGTTEVLKFLAKPGDVCIDVGAHIGLLTIPLALQVGPNGQVHAFEPVPRSAEGLRRALIINGIADRCSIHVTALADRAGFARFYGGTNSMMGSLYPGNDPSGHVDVPVTTIDRSFETGSKVSIVKIDAEGAEPAIARGMERIVLENPDIVIVAEMGLSHLEHTGLTIDEWLSAFNQLGLSEHWWIEENQARVHPFSPSDATLFHSVNILLCRPGNERLAALAKMNDEEMLEKNLEKMPTSESPTSTADEEISIVRELQQVKKSLSQEIATVSAVLNDEIIRLRNELALELRRNELLSRQRATNIARVHELADECSRLERELQRAYLGGGEKCQRALALAESRRVELVQRQAELSDTCRKLAEAQSQLATIVYRGVLAPSRRGSKPSPFSALRRSALLAAARKCMRSGAKADAARHYAELLALDGTKMNVWKQFGHALRSFDKQASLRGYLRALRLDPTNVDTCLHLGHLLKDLGHVEGGLLVFRAAHAIAPDFGPVREALEALGAEVSDENEPTLKAREARYSLRQHVTLWKAQAAARSARWEDAAALYRRLAATAPANATWLVQLGHSEKEARRMAEAEQAYYAAVAAEPLNWDANFQLAHFLRSKGDREGSSEYFRRAIILDPDMPTD